MGLPRPKDPWFCPAHHTGRGVRFKVRATECEFPSRFLNLFVNYNQSKDISGLSWILGGGYFGIT